MLSNRIGGGPAPLSAFLLLLSTAACSVMTHYPDEVGRPLQDFNEGKLQAAYEEVEKGFDASLDRLVYLLEGGMILHCAGNLAESNRVFAQAGDFIRAQQEKAVLSLSKGGEQLGSLLVNEKTIPYRGEPYERVVLHTFKALNYLFARDYEGARVEIRRSFAVQKENREIHQKEIARMEQEAENRGLNSSRLVREVEAHYRDQASILARAGNLYEDPFAYYVSALVYEFNGEYNDAYIDLKRADEIQPGIPCVENDLLRMARLAGLRSALREAQQRLGKEPRFLDRTREGELLVFFECGMAPRKTQIKIPLPIPDVGIVPLAFPKYQPVPDPVRTSTLRQEGGTLCTRTEMLTDLEAIAVRNLDDRMPTLVLKQALRAAAKGALAKTAADQGGWAGALAANLYNVVTEQADLRSWITLPRNLQVARVPLAAGTHTLVIELAGPGGRPVQRRTFSVDVSPGESLFVNLRTGERGLIDFHVYGTDPAGGSHAALGSPRIPR